MIIRNPLVSRERKFPGPDRKAIEFIASIPGYAPTRLVEVRPPPVHGIIGRLWIKDESGRFGTPSFKVLGALWATACWLRAATGNMALTFLEMPQAARDLRLRLRAATDGNHGRGVARVAQMLGIEAVIYVPHTISGNRKAGIASEGAAVVEVSGSYDRAVELAADTMLDRDVLIQDTSWQGYEETPGRIVEAYSTIFLELDDQASVTEEAPFTHIIVPIGVGSLADAAIRHVRRTENAPPVVLGVEPVAFARGAASVLAGKPVSIACSHSSIMEGLNCGTLSMISWPVLRDGVDAFVVIADHTAREAMTFLTMSGLDTGPTGAAAMGGLLDILSSERGGHDLEQLVPHGESRVLVLNTERNW